MAGYISDGNGTSSKRRVLNEDFDLPPPSRHLGHGQAPAGRFPGAVPPLRAVAVPAYVFSILLLRQKDKPTQSQSEENSSSPVNLSYIRIK